VIVFIMADCSNRSLLEIQPIKRIWLAR